MADPEDSAGALLAISVAVNCLLTAYKGDPGAAKSLQDGVEQMKAKLLASRASDRKIDAFDQMADVLLRTLRD